MRNHIITSYICPPIPLRDFDWCAYYEEEVEEGNHAFGRTREEAINNLLELE
jgi:hypothetical protein